MTWWVRDGTGWKDVTQPQINVGGVVRPVSRGLVYTGTKWERFFPHTEVTTTTITSGLTPPVNVGAAKTVQGTVYTVAGAISGGTVTVQQRAVGSQTWTNVGVSTALGVGASVVWSASVTPTICGATEFKAVYSGSPTNQGSESVPQAVTATVGTPAKPTGGALANTTATISWPAVAGATGYDVYRVGVTLTNPSGAKLLVSAGQTGLTFNDTLLSPDTTYTWSVIAFTGSCRSTESPGKTGHTGQTATMDTGTATIEVRPLKTNSYRPSGAWGYVGETVAQGYFDTSSRNYTGTIDYGGQAALQASVVAALGANGQQRWDHLVVSAARVYLFRKSGVGPGGTITVSLYNSPAEAGVGGAPVRAGTAVVENAASSGAGKWNTVGTEHWTALKNGTARSIVMYDARAAAYMQFDGKSKGANRCNLQLDCSWDYALTAAVPPAWTP